MTTTSASEVFGGAAPVGTIAQGQLAGNANYLPCDGADYLKSAYPMLDTTLLDTYGANTLTARSIGRTGQTSVAFGNGAFVAVTVGANTCLTSTDGVTWTSRNLPGITYFMGTGLVFGNGLFVALNYSTNVCYTSPDGITWTQRALPTPTSGNWSKLSFANGLFFASLNKNANQAQIATSPDGITWTTRATGGIQNIWEVIHTGSQFVGINNSQSSGATSLIGFSSDGINWLANNMTAYDGLTAVSGAWEACAYFAGKVLILQLGGVPRVSNDMQQFTPLMVPYGGGSYGGMKVLNGRLHLLNTAAASGGRSVAVTPDLINWKFYASAQTEGVLDAAFGNGVLVIGNYGQSGVLNTLSTLNLDTTRFRTPIMPRVGDGDRFYIKAK